MTKIIQTLFFIFLIQGVSGQTIYSTVSDGNWSNGSTWKNGNVPPSSLENNRKIIITHSVTYNRSSDLEIEDGIMTIQDGELVFPTSGNGSGRSMYVRQDGKLVIRNGNLIMPVFKAGGGNNSGNFYNDGGQVEITGSTVEVAQNFKSKEGAVTIFNSTCVKVGENYQNDESFEVYDRTCIEIGFHGSGNWDNDKGDVKAAESSVLLRGTSGNFKNKSYSSKIRTFGNATVAFSNLDMPGDLENNGTWEAPIAKYCVGQDITGSRANQIDFMGPEDCGQVNSFSCDCEPVSPLTNASAPSSQFNYMKGNCLDEICSYETEYFYANSISLANSMWPDVNGIAYGLVTVGLKNYTETEAREVYNTPDPGGAMPHAKKAFLAVSTLKLSKTDYAYFPQLLTAVTTCETWLTLLPKLTANNIPTTSNVAVNAAANYINEWIGTHMCPDRR